MSFCFFRAARTGALSLCVPYIAPDQWGPPHLKPGSGRAPDHGVLPISSRALESATAHCGAVCVLKSVATVSTEYVPSTSGPRYDNIERGPSGFLRPTLSQAWSGIGNPRTAMCVRNVDVHVSCSSHVDAQFAAFFIDPRAK